LGPFPLIPQKGICSYDELSHDSCDGELLAFPRRYQRFVFCLHVGIESGGDDGWQVDRSSQTGATTLDPFLALPFPRLPRDWRKTRQLRGLLAAQAAEFGHVGQDRAGRDLGDAGNAGEYFSARSEVFIGVDGCRDSGIDLYDIALDLPKTQRKLLFRQRVRCSLALAAVRSLIKAWRAVANCLRSCCVWLLG
jgi:hypothetical protein